MNGPGDFSAGLQQGIKSQIASLTPVYNPRMRKLRILVTNDDGFYGKGFSPLAQSLRALGEVMTVIPDKERSAVSHFLRLHEPIRAKALDRHTFLINGTPVDCVRFGILSVLRGRHVDLVVSGINQGPNLGDDVFYSGTVAAAMEGALMGIHAIAVSLVLPGKGHYEVAAEWARRIAVRVVQNGLPAKCFLNVNVPDVPMDEIEGVAVTRLGKRIYGRKIEHRRDPRGESYYWIAGEKVTGIKAKGTDILAVSRKRVSISPVRLDLTHDDAMPVLRKWDL